MPVASIVERSVVAPEVRDALAEGRRDDSHDSTKISHGNP
jgi:hypothetical protein